MNPLCSCSLEIESTEYYFLRCHNYATFCTILMNGLSSDELELRLDELVRATFYGHKNFDNDSNFKMLTGTTNFIKQTKRIEPAHYLANEIHICH